MSASSPASRAGVSPRPPMNREARVAQSSVFPIDGSLENEFVVGGPPRRPIPARSTFTNSSRPSACRKRVAIVHPRRYSNIWYTSLGFATSYNLQFCFRLRTTVSLSPIPPPANTNGDQIDRRRVSPRSGVDELPRWESSEHPAEPEQPARARLRHAPTDHPVRDPKRVATLVNGEISHGET